MTELKVGVSLGTAVVLGLSKARLMEVPTTGHFLVGERCLNNCAFCAEAAGATTGPHHLSRVTWPEFKWETIEGPLKSALDAGTLKRVCIQTVECPESAQAVPALLKLVRGLSPLALISVSAAPVSVARVKEFIDAGASNVGLPLDAATPEIYAAVKGRSQEDFGRAWEVLSKSAALWPGRISTHLIIGLGETEEEAVKFLSRAKDAGVTVGLFAFTPVRGTRMEEVAPPDVSCYRRVQLASYYLKLGGDPSKISFRDGKITRIPLDGPILDEVLEGIPFETSGCRYCNRPYYNERPGHVMMNYPRPLAREEAEAALSESGLVVPGESPSCGREKK